ncbi:hypothetical protein EVAR_24294_1 [Eumeta japonica]|uniref:Uncharacterized protein n=1 Tax=Eumeta variegata TaxID=151549 RepID=A0A4C1VFR8_EUMVA|nr:hypothetical protein EVAR_24294_1 [Eumeta japonica]
MLRTRTTFYGYVASIQKIIKSLPDSTYGFVESKLFGLSIYAPFSISAGFYMCRKPALRDDEHLPLDASSARRPTEAGCAELRVEAARSHCLTGGFLMPTSASRDFVKLQLSAMEY